MAENERKFDISAVVRHQKLINPSFQPESVLFHWVMNIKKTQLKYLLHKQQFLAKVAETAENSFSSGISSNFG